MAPVNNGLAVLRTFNYDTTRPIVDVYPLESAGAHPGYVAVDGNTLGSYTVKAHDTSDTLKATWTAPASCSAQRFKQIPGRDAWAMTLVNGSGASTTFTYGGTSYTLGVQELVEVVLSLSVSGSTWTLVEAPGVWQPSSAYRVSGIVDHSQDSDGDRRVATFADSTTPFPSRVVILDSAAALTGAMTVLATDTRAAADVTAVAINPAGQVAVVTRSGSVNTMRSDTGGGLSYTWSQTLTGTASVAQVAATTNYFWHLDGADLWKVHATTHVATGVIYTAATTTLLKLKTIDKDHVGIFYKFTADHTISPRFATAIPSGYQGGFALVIINENGTVSAASVSYVKIVSTSPSTYFSGSSDVNGNIACSRYGVADLGHPLVNIQIRRRATPFSDGLTDAYIDWKS